MSQPNLAEQDPMAMAGEAEPVLDQPKPQPVEGPKQKQKTDIYTVMLIISLICILIACVLLAWELSLWGSYPWWNTRDATPTLSLLDRWLPPLA